MFARKIVSAVAVPVTLVAATAFADEPLRAPRAAERQVERDVERQVDRDVERQVDRNSERPPANRVPQGRVEVQKVETGGTSQSHDEARTTRATELMGTDIVLENGEDLGQVSDLVIDDRSGQVEYVIVESKDDYRAIPWKTLAMYQGEQQADRYFILGLERDRFMQAPAINRTEWKTYSAPQWQTYYPNVNKFYSDVRTVQPTNVRRAERKIDQGLRQGEREIEQGERKAERRLNN